MRKPTRRIIKTYEPYFEPVGHLYQTPDGLILDSVTSIIKNSLKLYQYGDNERAKRGTAIHLTCQLFDEHNLDENSINEDIKENLLQYQAFLKDYNVKILQNELRRYHPKYLYAGTCDKIAIINNEYWLIDIKTGGQEVWHKWQTAAYVEMIKKEIPILKRGCLYLTNEKYSLIEYDYNMDFAEFLSLYTSYKIMKNYGYTK